MGRERICRVCRGEKSNVCFSVEPELLCPYVVSGSFRQHVKGEPVEPVAGASCFSAWSSGERLTRLYRSTKPRPEKSRGRSAVPKLLLSGLSCQGKIRKRKSLQPEPRMPRRLARHYAAVQSSRKMLPAVPSQSTWTSMTPSSMTAAVVPVTRYHVSARVSDDVASTTSVLTPIAGLAR